MRNLFLCLPFLLFITGCHQAWYFTIIDTTNPCQPHFQVSTSKVSKSDGLSFSLFDINEVNQNGNFVKKMWAITPIKNVKINQLIYGIPPAGYSELISPKPLELNKYYSVHGRYFFRLHKKDNVIVAEVFSAEAFINK